MSTPAMAFGVGLRNVVVSLWLIWVGTFCISRVFLLHEAYVAESNKRTDERWLLQQCKDPEFYSNIRQHTDLCTEVANNAGASLLLKALNRVASQTHACGSTSCVELVYVAMSRLGWQLGLLLALLMVVAPNFVYTLLLQLHRRRVAHSKEIGLLSSFSPPAVAAAAEGGYHHYSSYHEDEFSALRARHHRKSSLGKEGSSNNTVKLV